jgi:peptidylprolyl isomerase
MSRRTREKQLAKLAARRQAERQAAKRRRDITLGIVGGLVGLALLVVGYTILTGGNDDEAQPAATASATPEGEPGTRSGTVQAVAQLPETVACDGEVPRAAGEERPQFVGPPPMTIDTSATYTATIETSCGEFVVRLLPEIAPQGVNSFVFLAEKGFYDGLTFHRIARNFVIQGGYPLGDGTGGPGYSFDIETSPDRTFDSPGLLAYANSGPGSNGSQFFVTLRPTPQLDPGAGSGEYTIFGEVTEGMDVVRRIGKVPGTENPNVPDEMSVPTEAVYIDSITIDERPA